MSTPAPRSRHLVLGAGILMILIQLGLRGWALAGSWFFHDDMLLLADAAEAETASPVDYLTDPFDSQLMPWGRALVWAVNASGGADWLLAAVLTLIAQAAAGLACLWMLSTLFGARPAILVPLAAYLFTAMTLPSTMWWAASLNALPLQIGLFCSVAAWVVHLRTGRMRWLGLTLLALAFALSAYVKALLLIPLLAFLAVAYFADGHLGRRLLTVLRRQWLAVVCAVAVGLGYLSFYLVTAPRLVTAPAEGQALPLARTMLGEALPVGLVGGPWRWDPVAAPNALADPPAVLVALSWIGLVLLVGVVVRKRLRTGRSWVLLAGWALASYLLVLATRAGVLGPLPGLEYRYLADVACVWCLVLGLVTLELGGSSEGSAARTTLDARWRPGPRTVTVVAAAVSLSAVGSSVAYAQFWHHDNPTAHYFLTAQDELDGSGAVDLADEKVPQSAVWGWLGDRNDQSRLLPLVTPHARFPSASADLRVLDEHGRLAKPTIAEAGLESRAGPLPGCGWRIAGQTVAVPFEARVREGEWWLELRYLASGSGNLELVAGGNLLRVPVRRGLTESFAHVPGGFSEVTLRAVDPGLSLCLDRLVVGPIEPEEAR